MSYTPLVKGWLLPYVNLRLLAACLKSILIICFYIQHRLAHSETFLCKSPWLVGVASITEGILDSNLVLYWKPNLTLQLLSPRKCEYVHTYCVYKTIDLLTTLSTQNWFPWVHLIAELRWYLLLMKQPELKFFSSVTYRYVTNMLPYACPHILIYLYPKVMIPKLTASSYYRSNVFSLPVNIIQAW